MQREAQAAAASGDLSYYSVGLGANNGLYFGGKALAVQLKDEKNASAMPVPAGTYNVTIDSGYRAQVQVSTANADGTFDSNSTGSVMTVEGSQTIQVRVPVNSRMSIELQTINGDARKTLTDTSVRPLHYSVVSRDTVDDSTLDIPAIGEADIVPLKAGETKSILVHTKTDRAAGTKVTNEAMVYDGDLNEVAKTTATAERGAVSGKKNTSSLPATAATLAGIGALACGAAFFAFGGVELIRGRKRKDEE
jgi:hypothetical protein